MRLSLIHLLVLSVAILGLSACQRADNLYGYSFQSAHLTYQISGSSTGTSDVLIKGEKKRIHNEIKQKKLDGTEAVINTLLIQDGDKLYSLDTENKTGTLVKQPFYAELKQLSPQERQQRMIMEAVRDGRSSEEQKKNPPTPVSTENIAGQTCDVYVTDMLQTCLWQGVPLKGVASLPDYGIQTETVATKIELNTNIADSEFDIPKDYQITELN